MNRRKCNHPNCDWVLDPDGKPLTEQVIEHKREEHGGELIPEEEVTEP